MFADDAVEVAVVWGCDEVLLGVPLALRQRSYCLGATRIDNNVSMHWPFSFFFVLYACARPSRVANTIAAAFICGADMIIRMFSFVLGSFLLFTTTLAPWLFLHLRFTFSSLHNLFHVYGLTYSFAVYFLCPTQQEFFSREIKLGSQEHTWARTSLQVPNSTPFLDSAVFG